MRISVLGSGSTGNSVLIATEKTNVLVDAGMSAKQTLLRLAGIGVDYADLDAVLITHEHGDHAGGLRVLLKTVECPVFISDLTRESYFTSGKGANAAKESRNREKALSNRTVSIQSGFEFRIGDIDFHPFTVPHDAADNFGFVASNRGIQVATLMDFGYFTSLVKQRLKGCDGIIIESNHALDMLMACDVYPWELKQRIASNTGHLSNESLATWLENDFDGSATEIVLTHLSQKANEPNLARLTAESALKSRETFYRAETNISLSYHDVPTPWIEF